MTGFMFAATRRAALAVLAGTLAVGAWAADAPRVKFVTTAGEFVVEVDPAKSPKTVENFLQYVKDGHYDGTLFHRVIPGFMIQGGGFTRDFQQKPVHKPVRNEADNGLKNAVGTIAMARTPDPHSATAQFFINVRDNISLDAVPGSQPNGYTVFGKVVSGMDVVNQIKGVPTTTKAPYQNVPVTPVVITSATVIQ